MEIFVQVPMGRNTTAYHRLSSCIIGKVVTVEAAEAAGYKPCAKCKPLTGAPPVV